MTSGQRQLEQEEFRAAVCALLMRPILDASHESFVVVRRHASALRDWFARETGWPLHVERDGARLYKRPADLDDATRGLPGYDRRRYVLLCLAVAVLERADRQITLRILGERLLQLAADPVLAAQDFAFMLGSPHERRELVAVCRTLLDLGIMQRVAGDEESFVQTSGEHADALYDVQRRALAGLLAAVRGPSTWTPEEMPSTLPDRLRALVDEHVPDSDEGRRNALRHRLSRRLLDDPAVYVEMLDVEAQAYFLNQRGTMASRLCDATGLIAEQRAEGLALADETGTLTDVAMPAEGTVAHATLLVAEYLATAYRRNGAFATDSNADDSALTRKHDVVEYLRQAKGRFGRYWRRSAREPGAEHELTDIVLERLEQLQLVVRDGEVLWPLPALARFAAGEADIRPAKGGRATTSRPA